VRYEQQEALKLAFATVINDLPDRQRDALILDALGYSADEAAEALDTTRTSVYSALQRARKVIGADARAGVSAQPELAATR
jgi:RNA polymerase sigma-70 factor (ECF subfamily)